MMLNGEMFLRPALLYRADVNPVLLLRFSASRREMLASLRELLDDGHCLSDLAIEIDSTCSAMHQLSSLAVPG